MSATATAFTARIGRIEISATMAINNEATVLRSQGVDLVDFGAGEPHFTTPEHIKQAGIEAIQKNFTKYTPVAGIKDLRQAIVERHKQDFGSNYTFDETIVTTGGKNALFNTFQVLVDHGDEVIIPVPYWVSFKDMVQFCGGKCCFVPTSAEDGFRLTAAMIEKAITPRTKIILVNSPNNPSGAVVAPEDLAAIVKLAASRGIYVMSDECYVYLDYTGKSFSLGSLTEYKDSLLVMGSLSKTYSMTGWRLGYALAPLAVVKQLTKLQSQSTSNPTSIVQKAGLAALTSSQQCVAGMKAEYITLRERIVNGLRQIPGVKCNMPEGAFYAFPDVSEVAKRAGIDTLQLSSRLLHEGHVVTVPGEAFGLAGHIRCSYATSADAIDRGLERIAKFFAAL
ncbi:MAG: pyridoxal phosphate-dependent aminotransferase [Acidobacteriota bacterium]|nr:pyridoxal phosphate-dependent aminotransferase [Acidobacteriota bacterium]